MVVEPTHLKYAQVKLDHFPRDRGEHKKCLKPPPRKGTTNMLQFLLVQSRHFPQKKIVQTATTFSEKKLHLFRVRLGQKLCGSALTQKKRWKKSGRVQPGGGFCWNQKKLAKKIWKCLKVRDVVEKIKPLSPNTFSSL